MRTASVRRYSEDYKEREDQSVSKETFVYEGMDARKGIPVKGPDGEAHSVRVRKATANGERQTTGWALEVRRLHHVRKDGAPRRSNGIALPAWYRGWEFRSEESAMGMLDLTVKGIRSGELTRKRTRS